MEPLSPHDPIQKLLAQGREVKVRPNFTQNVLRQARNTPQNRGWLAGWRAWWEENTLTAGLTVAGGALAALALAFLVQPADTPSGIAGTAAMTKSTPAPAVVNDMPLLPVGEVPWETPLQTESLLAVEDTSLFTDSEISFLLR
jgi:hypothetical protein